MGSEDEPKLEFLRCMMPECREMAAEVVPCSDGRIPLCAWHYLLWEVGDLLESAPPPSRLHRPSLRAQGRLVRETPPLEAEAVARLHAFLEELMVLEGSGVSAEVEESARLPPRPGLRAQAARAVRLRSSASSSHA